MSPSSTSSASTPSPKVLYYHHHATLLFSSLPSSLPPSFMCTTNHLWKKQPRIMIELKHPLDLIKIKRFLIFLFVCAALHSVTTTTTTNFYTINNNNINFNVSSGLLSTSDLDLDLLVLISDWPTHSFVEAAYQQLNKAIQVPSCF